MSNNYDNTNRGAIFVNEDKRAKRKEQDTTNWADYQGKINVNGEEFYISLWMKEVQKGKNAGKKFFSVAIKEIEDGGNKTSSKKVEDDVDEFDDLPF